jgi:hypothetical protein
MTTIKTFLFAAIVAAGIGACHHDRDTHTPANNTYGASADMQPAATPSQSVNTPDLNGTSNSGVSGVTSGDSTGAAPNSATGDQNATPGTTGGERSSNDNSNTDLDRTNTNTNTNRTNTNTNNPKGSTYPSSTSTNPTDNTDRTDTDSGLNTSSPSPTPSSNTP